MIRFRAALSLSLVSSFSLVAAPAWAQDAPAAPFVAPLQGVLEAPQDALVTAANDREITLGIGTDDGARPGALYGVLRADAAGQMVPRVRMQILRATRTESTARVVEADPEVIVTVGDTVRFLGDAPLPVTPLEPAPPATPEITPPVVNPPTFPPPVANPPAPDFPLAGTPANPNPNAGFTLVNPASAPAAITSIDGDRVTLDAGEVRGVRSGTNLPVVRNGSIVGLVHIEATTPELSSGSIIFRDPNSTPIAVGDVIGALSQPATGITGGTGTTDVTDTAGNTTPATVVRFETPASNAVVPRADRSYELLAVLAASGLITRYPANVFHDDGTRYHRTEEDITFSRAQIAELIRDALASGREGGPSRKERAALGSLITMYGPELRLLNVPAERLNEFTPRGFQFGVGGQQRASVVSLSGDEGNGAFGLGRSPFSERQGGRRTRSGLDSRTVLFGSAGRDLDFFAQIDAGSQPSRDGNDPSFRVRRAVVSYNAGKLLRGLRLEAGRDEVWFGPGHFGTLLLGDTAGPLNMLRASFERGAYKLEGLYAPLGRGPNGGQRSLYAKNAQLRLGNQARIGFAESVLAPSNSLDAKLLAATFSPVPLFLVERSGSMAQEGKNVLVEGYIETSIARGVRGWGEVLIDDIGSNGNNITRNRIGTLVGLHLFRPEDPTRLGLFAEYTNLQFRTYLNLGQGADYDYYYRGRPLAYPVAPVFGDGRGGAESVRVEGYWRPLPRLRVGGGIEFADINSEDPVIARQQTLRLRAAYDLTRNLTLTARAQRVATQRPNFIANEPQVNQRLFQFELAHSF